MQFGETQELRNQGEILQDVGCCLTSVVHRFAAIRFVTIYGALIPPAWQSAARRSTL